MFMKPVHSKQSISKYTYISERNQETAPNAPFEYTDKAYISVPVAGLRTSYQSVPYVAGPMPRKVEASLLKYELQKAEVSDDKLPNIQCTIDALQYNIVFHTASTTKYNCNNTNHYQQPN